MGQLATQNTELVWDGENIFDIRANFAALSDAEISILAENYRHYIPEALQDPFYKVVLCDSLGYCLLENGDFMPSWSILNPSEEIDSRCMYYKGQTLTPISLNSQLLGYIAYPHEEYKAYFYIEKSHTSSAALRSLVIYKLTRSFGDQKTISERNKLTLKSALEHYYTDIKKLGFL